MTTESAAPTRPAACPHEWRDHVLGAHQADAPSWPVKRWLDELAYADGMGWLTAAQHQQALDELDRHGLIWPAAVARAEQAAFAARACRPTRQVGDHLPHGWEERG